MIETIKLAVGLGLGAFLLLMFIYLTSYVWQLGKHHAMNNYMAQYFNKLNKEVKENGKTQQ